MTFDREDMRNRLGKLRTGEQIALLNACDALAGALREAVEHLELAYRTIGSARAIAKGRDTLDRLGYGSEKS